MSAYLNELHLPNRILLGPGPSNVHPRVVQAMLMPMLGHLDPDFWPVLDHVRDMLRLVLGTTHPWTLPLSATGTAGMEAAFCNVVEPGDRVVIVVNGFFGERMVEIASRCGADVQRLEVPWGKPVLPELVAQALAAQRLHTGHHDRGGVLVSRRLHHPEGERRIDQVQFVECLLDQFVAVGQDERPAAPALHEQGEDDRFARAGGQHQQGAVHPACGRGQQRGHGFMLVGPWGQP
jgi:hypothetical protein